MWWVDGLYITCSGLYFFSFALTSLAVTLPLITKFQLLTHFIHVTLSKFPESISFIFLFIYISLLFPHLSFLRYVLQQCRAVGTSFCGAVQLQTLLLTVKPMHTCGSE